MNVRPTRENVKYIGRAFEYDGNAILGFSGSGIEFVTCDETITINIAGDETAEKTEKLYDRARLAIYVNDERKYDFMVSRPSLSYDLRCNDGDMIRVIKLSENAMSSAAVTGIISDKGIKPAEDKKLFVEIIGDSITCGYGVDDEMLGHVFSTMTEDCMKSYSLKTVRKLDADGELCSLSGWGIISGYSDDGETRHTEQLIPSVYEKCGYSVSKIFGFNPQEYEWDFKGRRRPDITVINLGTNDASYCLDHKDRQDLYSAEYASFLETVRKHRPGTPILCILGVMGETLCPSLQKAVDIYKEKTGDSNIYTKMFKDQLEEDGRVVDYHPTVVTHEKVSEILKATISEILGL